LEVSPANCHVLPVVSVRVKFPEDPLRQPSMLELLLPVEVCVVCVVVVVVVEVESGVEVDDGEVEEGDCELVSGVVDDEGDVD
jgi:hypothetical protein